jgi:hypothetical protein
MNKQQRIERSKKANQAMHWKRNCIANHFAQWWDSGEFVKGLPSQLPNETGHEYYARLEGQTLEEWYQQGCAKEKGANQIYGHVK